MTTDRDQTAKPWAGNRRGDPRQLLHEAVQFECLIKIHKRDAERYRRYAEESERHAEHYEEVANDYREWAAEQQGAINDAT